MMGGWWGSRFQEIGLAWKDRFRSCYHLDGNCNLTGNLFCLIRSFLSNELALTLLQYLDAISKMTE